MKRLLLFSSVLTIALLPTAARAATLFTQASNASGALASQNDTHADGYGAFATTYDDFTLAHAANIDSVSWTGSFFNGSAAQSVINSFTLAIYSDNKSLPGTLLYSTTVSGDANASSLNSHDPGGDSLYSYSDPMSFLASANTEYFLSVVANSPVNPQWGWEFSNAGNDSGAQTFFGSTSATASNQAFSLNGTLTATPEPESLVLLGTGILSLTFPLARRRNSALIA